MLAIIRCRIFCLPGCYPKICGLELPFEYLHVVSVFYFVFIIFLFFHSLTVLCKQDSFSLNVI